MHRRRGFAVDVKVGMHVTLRMKAVGARRGARVLGFRDRVNGKRARERARDVWSDDYG